MKWKLILALIALSVIAALAGCNRQTETASTTATSSGDEVVKPDRITFFVDAALISEESGQAECVARLEELMGIDLEIIQPDHSAYYDVMGQRIASGDWPDVMELSSSYYTSYASEGILWDMTEAWENSDLRKSDRYIGEDVINGLYIDGRLYGFPPERGNGCMTYIKKAWLDNVGLDVPTNFEEYLAVCDAFTNGDPDGNGVNGDTYAVSAAGFIGGESPYTNYLQEFYWNAYPGFYQKDGVWTDGFEEQAMKDALQRLQDAYAAGYIDRETLTNGTSDCRNKFYEDRFGIFTYWAGTWATNLKNNLEANGHDGTLIPLPPIAEIDAYWDRVPGVLSITTQCENPEGVFKYFLEAMFDGGEIQEVWCYGVEGTHWSTAAETINGNTYSEGEFHGLQNPANPRTQFNTGVNINPMIALATFEGEDPGANMVQPEARESQELFNTHSKPAPLVRSTDEMAQYNGDLMTLKRTVVADVVTGAMSVDAAYARYESEHGAEWSQLIVDSLNRQEGN